MYEVYTDGACYPNPGIGSYAYVILCNNRIEHQSSNTHLETTNNRMELMAAIAALSHIEKYYEVFDEVITLYTDSKYLQLTMSKNKLRIWRKRDLKTDPIKNIDLWTELEYLNGLFNIKWKWVRGHSGNFWNEYVDKLAANHWEHGYE